MSASALETILTDIVAIMDTVAALGTNYGYDRIALEPDTIEATFGTTDTNFAKGWSVRAAMVDREETTEDWTTQGDNVRVHTLRITAYREVHDLAGSRTAFRIAVEQLCDALRATPSTDEFELVQPPQVRRDGLTWLAGETYLVHDVEVLVMVQERLTR